MARRLNPTIDTAVLTAVAQHPQGASVDQLVQATQAPRRSVQRRLAALVADGHLRAAGAHNQRRYHVVTPAGAALELSPEAAKLRLAVAQPVSMRTPVGYQAAFLESYRPNETSYLSSPLRERLRVLGQAPGPARPMGTYARQLLDRLLIDLSWASSRLEGNTYTRLDTQNLIQFGHAAPGKEQREAQMILNHKAAIEMLVSNVEEVGFDRFTIFNLHALLATGLLENPQAIGQLRRIEVGITGTAYLPTAIPQRIEEFFELLLAKAKAIVDPFEQAFFAMVHLPYLQPFEDVNKRVSRLAANIPFIKHNLSPLSFLDMPEAEYLAGTLAVYEQNRVELLRDVFVYAYERSCQRYSRVRDALPEPDPVRFRNRLALTEIVNVVVRDVLAIDVDVIRALAVPLTTPDDVEPLVSMAVAELHGLHEGNILRHRLRLSEFRRWQATLAALK